jgi:hypothetical protein
VARVLFHRVRLERTRQFGACHLGLELWRRLERDRFFEQTIDDDPADAPWSRVAALLANQPFAPYSTAARPSRPVSHNAGTSTGRSPPPPSSCTQGRSGHALPVRRTRGPTGCHALPTARANQLQSCFLPPHPQLQLLAMLVNLHAIDPVSRPSQNLRPIVCPHLLRLAKSAFSEKAGLPGRAVGFLRRAGIS